MLYLSSLHIENIMVQTIMCTKSATLNDQKSSIDGGEMHAAVTA